MWDLVSSTLPGQQLSLGMDLAPRSDTHTNTREKNTHLHFAYSPRKARWLQSWMEANRGGRGGGTHLYCTRKEREREREMGGGGVSNNDTCGREAKRGVPNGTHTTSSSSSTTRCFASSPDQQAPERAKASHLKQSRYDKKVPPFLVVLAGSRLTPSCGHPPMHRHGKWGRCGCP